MTLKLRHHQIFTSQAESKYFPDGHIPDIILSAGPYTKRERISVTIELYVWQYIPYNAFVSLILTHRQTKNRSKPEFKGPNANPLVLHWQSRVFCLFRRSMDNVRRLNKVISRLGLTGEECHWLGGAQDFKPRQFNNWIPGVPYLESPKLMAELYQNQLESLRDGVKMAQDSQQAVNPKFLTLLEDYQRRMRYYQSLADQGRASILEQSVRYRGRKMDAQLSVNQLLNQFSTLMNYQLERYELYLEACPLRASDRDLLVYHWLQMLSLYTQNCYEPRHWLLGGESKRQNQNHTGWNNWKLKGVDWRKKCEFCQKKTGGLQAEALGYFERKLSHMVRWN